MAFKKTSVAVTLPKQVDPVSPEPHVGEVRVFEGVRKYWDGEEWLLWTPTGPPVSLEKREQ